MTAICGWVGEGHGDSVTAMLEAVPHRGDRTEVAELTGAALGYRWWAGRSGAPAIHRNGAQVVACAGTLAPPVLSPAAHLGELLGSGSPLDSVDGAFAAAAWEPERRRLTLLVDPFGVCSLFVVEHRGAFYFASELKQLLAIPDLPVSLDPVAVHQYLTVSFVPGDRTPVTGVRRVLPGRLLIREEGSVRSERYFTLREAIDPGLSDRRAAARAVRQAWRDAVARRLTGEREAALALSGGIDSSGVGVWLAEAGVGVRAFSLDFGERSVERSQAEAVAAHLGFPFTLVKVGGADVATELMAIAWHLDLPFGDPVTGPQYLLGRAARRAGLSVVFNGEGGDCYLRGVPVESLEQWRAIVASDSLAQVEGAFAIAWAASDGAVELARDVIGERTLYYAQVRGGLVFASTIAAVLASGLVDRRLDVGALAAYLSCGYVPGEGTLVAGIRELLPGEIVRFHRGAVTLRRFWSIPEEPPAGWDVAEADVTARLRCALEDAVARRLPANESVGAFLSGGLDSSLVVALARRQYQGRVRAYSIAFGAGYPNELEFSALVARHCEVDHHVLELSPPAVVRDLDATIACLDKPIGDPLTVPNALLFREAARDVGVVLNGEGGDPCFGGPKNVPMLLAELLGDATDDGDPHARARNYLLAHQKCYGELASMLTGEARAAIADDALERPITRHFEDGRWLGFVTKLMALNFALKGAHHILPKVDALGAAAGVVARSPLFDRAVVELAFAIPPQLKLRGAVEKYVLKEAVRDLLPGTILDRPKSGMLVPVEGWFEGPLLPLARERLLDGLPPGVIDRGYVERLLGGRLGGLRPRRGAKIWLLLTLESWLRAFGVRP